MEWLAIIILCIQFGWISPCVFDKVEVVPGLVYQEMIKDESGCFAACYENNTCIALAYRKSTRTFLKISMKFLLFLSLLGACLSVLTSAQPGESEKEYRWPRWPPLHPYVCCKPRCLEVRFEEYQRYKPPSPLFDSLKECEKYCSSIRFNASIVKDCDDFYDKTIVPGLNLDFY
ncbi:unnamed protein product [Cylicocyclus nassatus]|uniref:Apple domain-containing protein n=1 Tax=Cylicocyclus nassatus TaxID=53992 RepID=A0AA36GX64_CYLNA|nr:unnamed protein product [Cylicocyclus nassatus]